MCSYGGCTSRGHSSPQLGETRVANRGVLSQRRWRSHQTLRICSHPPAERSTVVQHEVGVLLRADLGRPSRDSAQPRPLLVGPTAQIMRLLPSQALGVPHCSVAPSELHGTTPSKLTEACGGCGWRSGQGGHAPRLPRRGEDSALTLCGRCRSHVFDRPRTWWEDLWLPVRSGCPRSWVGSCSSWTSSGSLLPRMPVAGGTATEMSREPHGGHIT